MLEQVRSLDRGQVGVPQHRDREEAHECFIYSSLSQFTRDVLQLSGDPVKERPLTVPNTGIDWIRQLLWGVGVISQSGQRQQMLDRVGSSISFGQITETDTPPSVILEQGTHQGVTNQLRALLPYGEQYGPEEAWPHYQTAYAAHPDWLDAIAQYFK